MQLVLASPDTNLLSSNEFRRDQIWIVEKDKTGASELYSLSDVTGILKAAPYEKWYLSGRLGGISAAAKKRPIPRTKCGKSPICGE